MVIIAKGTGGLRRATTGLRRSATGLRGAGSRRLRLNRAKHAGLAHVLDAENAKGSAAGAAHPPASAAVSMKRAVSESVIATKTSAGVEPASSGASTMTLAGAAPPSLLDQYDSDGEEWRPPRTELMRRKQRPPGEIDWVALMQYNSAVVDLDQRLDREAADRARAQFRRDLDLQLQEKHQQQCREAELKGAELRRQNEHFERIQLDMEREQNERKQRVLHEKEVRLQQIRANIKKKETAQEVRRQLNQRRLERMRQEQAQLKAEAAARLAREKAKLVAVKKQNDALQAEKRREKAEQERLEVEQQKAYAAMIDAQERARTQFYQKKKERQEANIEMLLKSTAKEQAASAALENKIREAQQQYDRQQAEIAQVKEQQRKQMKEAIAIELKRQVEAHAKQKADQIRADLDYSEVVRQRLAEIDERNVAEQRQRKQKLLAQAEILNRQMAEMELRKQRERAAMSETELAMNRQILEKVRHGVVTPSSASGIRPRPY